MSMDPMVENVCSYLGLPNEIRISYESLGLSKLFDWQAECLYQTNVAVGDNLIYCAPTSGGKTLVAEFIILKNAIANQKKALFVLPFVSLVAEKEKQFRRLLARYNRSIDKSQRIKVKAFYGDNSFHKSKPNERILICTIEKANSIINGLLSTVQIRTVGCIVIDEMHTLGDPQRGFLLEILVR